MNNNQELTIEISALAYNTILQLTEYVQGIDGNPTTVLMSLLKKEEDKYLIKCNKKEASQLINCLLAGIISASYIITEAEKLEKKVDEQAEMITELIAKIIRMELTRAERPIDLMNTGKNKNLN